ncbi:hypothetical protein ACFWRZ_08995 [Streptomyces rubiginosohelvolus]|uniref:hypothetical protein n=1 Tax=Streptomyces rubiginosohelvolus TaxID=67362 RepID=UPI00364C6749
MPISPADTAAVVSHLLSGAFQHDEAVLRERALHTGLMWRCPCRAVNAHDGNACTECGARRLWSTDRTPPRYEYGQLLEDLREALKEWFDDRPGVRRPAAVGFRVTTDYDDGPAWATDGATAYFTDSPDGVEYPHDFERTAVADALVEIADFDQPQTGDRLIVVVPAL